MKFYRIDMHVVLEEEDIDDAPRARRLRSRRDNAFWEELSNKAEKYSEKIADKGCFFMSYTIRTECTFGMVVRSNMDVEKYVSGFAKAEKIEIDSTEIREITLIDFSRLLQDGERNGFVYDDSEVLREYELDGLVGHGHMRGYPYEEAIIRQREKEAIYLSAESYFAKDALIAELDRIFAGKSVKKAYGHPVDYLIQSDDKRTIKGVTQLLVQALYGVGRVDNRRYCEIELESDSRFLDRFMESLFKSCAGGTVVITFCADVDFEEDDLAHGEYSYIEDLCKIIRRHCRDVLTILCLPRECTRIKNMLYEHMGNSTFVEIKEKMAVDEEAVDYLKRCAKECRIRSDKNLVSAIEKDHGYLIPELNEIFDEWYCRKLKTNIYSQYKDISGVKAGIKEEKPRGSAYEELDAMIGLSSAKAIIHQALDSYKAQIIFKDKGMQIDSFCNHMIFTGNPGTAKTTVARLFARILKDNEVLSRGQCIEVGRGDLVGKYVGWTAHIIKKVFKEAIGGVLFIDEAYSLVDDRNGSFGDEAINTIVQEMENHRDEVIVIFAGYPDKMETFLDKNPGLRSRIAHHVHFEDYDTDELCQIAGHIAAQKGLKIEEEAMEKIRDIVSDARTRADFGNGRYVRNVIEKAKMAQSSRLVRMDYDEVTQEDIKHICAEDVEVPKIGSGKDSRQIGFAVA